jgi:hypothetical protein
MLHAPEVTAMLNRLKASLAALAFLGLAACQTTGGPSATAVSKLQAAGYEAMSIPKSFSEPGITVTGLYLCMPSKCSELGMVMFATIKAPASPIGVTAEEQIRRGDISNARFLSLLNSSIPKAERAEFQVTSTRQYVRNGMAGFTFEGRGAPTPGSRLVMKADARVRGNEADAILSFGGSSRQAVRGLALSQPE